MSNLKLFFLHAGAAKQLPASSMALEKSLQTLIEHNVITPLQEESQLAETCGGACVTLLVYAKTND